MIKINEFELPPSKMQDYLNEQSVISLATVNNEQPFCCSVFFAYLPERNLLAFKSEENTGHIRNIWVNELVAGSLYSLGNGIVSIRGLQFTGSCKRAKGHLLSIVRKHYYKKHPMARVKSSPFWIIEPKTMKMIDNTLGMGNKLTWMQKATVNV